MDAELDHYKVLGLPSGEKEATLSLTEIVTAYRHKAVALHPNKCRDNPNAAANFHQLHSSYQILKDEKSRKLFDDSLRVKREIRQRRTEYEAKRQKRVSELEKREKSAAQMDRDEGEERKTAETLRREIAMMRSKYAEGRVCYKARRPKKAMKFVSKVVGAAEHEAFERTILEKLRNKCA